MFGSLGSCISQCTRLSLLFFIFMFFRLYLNFWRKSRGGIIIWSAALNLFLKAAFYWIYFGSAWGFKLIGCSRGKFERIFWEGECSCLSFDSSSSSGFFVFDLSICYWGGCSCLSSDSWICSGFFFLDFFFFLELPDLAESSPWS